MRRHLPALLVVLATIPCAAPAAGPAGDAFTRDFRDQTLRIDLVRTGDAAREIVALDELYAQGPWAGRRDDLTRAPAVGRTLATLYDAVSGEPLFAVAFDSIFGEYRTTGPAASGVARSFHETVLAPMPRRPVRFVLGVRDASGAQTEVFATTIDPDSVALVRETPAEAAVVVEQVVSGPLHRRVDLAFVGEGYTAAEEALFRADLAAFTDVLFAQEPYASLRGLFNVRGVLVPSPESGCDEPRRGVFRDTTLDASFNALGSERYLLVENNRRLRDVAAHVPYDALFVMVNHERYGGGGIFNLYCTFTTRNQWREYLFLHEFGHSFAGLADEYYTSSTAYSDFYPQGVEPAEANITALLDPRRLKWADLATPGGPVPTPWEKTAFDEMDRQYQAVRERLNDAIAELQRTEGETAELERLKAEGERLSRLHAEKVDAFLASCELAGSVGAFEGAGYAAEGLYRPMLDCIMFSKGAKPFCRVCQAAIAATVQRHAGSETAAQE